MINLTPAILSEATGCDRLTAQKWCPYLIDTMNKFGIDTPLRTAHFLSEVAWESAGFKHLREDLDYSAPNLLKYFGKHFTPEEAHKYAHNPMLIASRAYANRYGNGDEASHDGWRYRGGGLPQLTFHDNYAACGNALGIDLVGNPDLIIDPKHASNAAGWYWMFHNCGELADRDDVLAVRKAFNGGENGIDGVERLLLKCKQALIGGA